VGEGFEVDGGLGVSEAPEVDEDEVDDFFSLTLYGTFGFEGVGALFEGTLRTSFDQWHQGLLTSSLTHFKFEVDDNPNALPVFDVALFNLSRVRG